MKTLKQLTEEAVKQFFELREPLGVDSREKSFLESIIARTAKEAIGSVMVEKVKTLFLFEYGDNKEWWNTVGRSDGFNQAIDEAEEKAKAFLGE